MTISELPQNFRLTLNHYDQAISKRTYGPDGRESDPSESRVGVATWHCYVTHVMICSAGDVHQDAPFCRGHGLTPDEAIQESLNVLGSWLTLEKIHIKGI
jgi:hypothetical protein